MNATRTPKSPANVEPPEEQETHFCRFCIHSKMERNEVQFRALEAVCTCPKATRTKQDTIYFLIDGQPRYTRCFDIRLSTSECGESGQWFERKTGLDPHK